MSPRWATAVIFFVDGAAVGTWVAMIPWVQAELGVSKTVMGLVLPCAALGAMVAAPVAGQLLTRMPSRRVVGTAAFVLTLLLPIPVFAPAPLAVAAALLLFGAFNGATDMSMNAHGVAVQRVMGRPIMSGLHAGWSLGALAGAATVAMATSAGLDPRLQACGIALVLLCLVLAARGRLGDTTGLIDPGAGRLVLPSRAVLPLSLLAFLVAMVEGGIGDWSGIHLRRDLGAEPGVAASAFAVFALGLVVGRLVGDRLNRRLGPGRLVSLGMALVPLALGPALVVGRPDLLLAAIFVSGVGIANAIPLVFAAAGSIPPSGPSLSAVFTVGFLGFVVGPPLVGALADVLGLGSALGLLLVVAFIVALVARRVPGVERASGGQVAGAATPQPWG